MLNKLNDKKFYELVANKKIAFVCPSKCVIGSKQKDLIESYDLVVRINRQHPVPIHMVEDIGSRTDILYNSNLGDASDNLIENLKNGYLDILKCVCYPEDSMLCSKFEDLAKKYGNITSYAWHYNLTAEMMQQANLWGIECPNQQHDFFVGHTGTIALYHILRNDPREVYITGMTFYREPYFEGYKEANHSPSSEEKKQIYDKWASGERPKKLHNIDMDAELEFFNYLRKECNIKVDPIMEKILS